MAIQIRLYQPSDKDFILSLVPRFSEFELPEWRTREEIDRANLVFLRQALDDLEPDSAIFVAEAEDGALAGFVHLQTQTDYFSSEKNAYLSDVAVARDFEGQGIGRMLLETAEEWTRKKGYALLTLYVFAGNGRAQQIYEKQGFRQEVIKYVKKIS